MDHGPRRGGLGRGLEAILHARTAAAPTERRSQLEEAIEDLVYDGLDGLTAVLDLDLCAYLHVPDNAGPQLCMRTPDLATIGPTRAFDLFSGMRSVLEAGPEQVDVNIGGFLGTAIGTDGPQSRGLHVLGRSDRGLDLQECRAAMLLCRSLGRAVHVLETTLGFGWGEPPLGSAVEGAGHRLESP